MSPVFCANVPDSLFPLLAQKRRAALGAGFHSSIISTRVEEPKTVARGYDRPASGLNKDSLWSLTTTCRVHDVQRMVVGRKSLPFRPV